MNREVVDDSNVSILPGNGTSHTNANTALVWRLVRLAGEEEALIQTLAAAAEQEDIQAMLQIARQIAGQGSGQVE